MPRSRRPAASGCCQISAPSSDQEGQGSDSDDFEEEEEDVEEEEEEEDDSDDEDYIDSDCDDTDEDEKASSRLFRLPMGFWDFYFSSFVPSLRSLFLL